MSAPVRHRRIESRPVWSVLHVGVSQVPGVTLTSTARDGPLLAVAARDGVVVCLIT